MPLNNEAIKKNQDIRYAFKRLENLERQFKAVMQEVVPDGYESNNAMVNFHQALMWCGSALNKLTSVDKASPNK